ncbi:hypothetical protein VNI00_009496 [Paramarasmius palmivorus]|uniref:Uncharacterized protein n=1 Tax=Paramarasmius palmivorus TaxID=297713 RepID=A0AAW0CPY6_9AGAR
MRCTSFVALAAALTLASAAPSTLEARKNGMLLAMQMPAHLKCNPRKQTFKFPHIVGSPVDNCKGGTTDLKTTIGGDTSVSQTWKYGVSEGFSADGGEELPIGVSFENSDTWSNTEAKTFRQNIDITIQPGKKAALIAKVTHKRFLGRIRLNYGDPSGEPGKNDYHYIWYANGVGSIQPTDQVTYDQRIVGCDEDI